MTQKEYIGGTNTINRKLGKNQNLLEYGDILSEYHGKGNLIVVDGAGEKQFDCSFEAAQYTNGEIIILCHNLPPFIDFLISYSPVKKFEGITEEGWKFRSNDATNSLLPKRYLPHIQDNQPQTDIALHTNEILITQSNADWSEVRFGITNLEFEDRTKNDDNEIVFLPLKYGDIQLNFKKLVNYQHIFKRISTLRTIGVTGEIIVNIHNQEELSEITTVINDVCFLLSLKNGTKIVWIYYCIYDKQSKCIIKKHASKITKRYNPLDIYYLNSEGPIRNKQFLEASYPHYTRLCTSLKLNKGTIDTYLDAKSEADFLESRGGKIAIAIEKVKYEYLQCKEKDTHYIVPEKQFEKLVKPLSEQVKKFLKEQEVNDPGQILAIANEDKIEGLNRKSFNRILKDFSKEFNLNLKPDEVSLFINCRNSLVHRGDFYCLTAKTNEIEKCTPLPTIKHEYFFLVNMLDRIFLKILEQDDRSIEINWRNPPEEIVKWLL